MGGGVESTNRVISAFDSVFLCAYLCFGVVVDLLSVI